MNVRWTCRQVLDQLGKSLTFQQVVDRSGWTRAELRTFLHGYLTMEIDVED